MADKIETLGGYDVYDVAPEKLEDGQMTLPQEEGDFAGLRIGKNIKGQVFLWNKFARSEYEDSLDSLKPYVEDIFQGKTPAKAEKKKTKAVAGNNPGG